MRKYGCQNMVGRLRQVVVRRPDEVFAGVNPDDWNYHGTPDLARAQAEHRAFVRILEESGADVVLHDQPLDGLADAIFTHDSALVTDHGTVALRMGKALREGEEDAMARFLEKLGVPLLGRLAGDGRAEGGDLMWLDKETLAVGLGFRTNEEGAAQLRDLLAPIGAEVVAYDLPVYQGPGACLHLMSVVSMVDDDLAVVYPPLMPVRLLKELERRGIELIEAPEDEFVHGQATNVLALAPRDLVMLQGNPVTEDRLRAAGCRVQTYRGDEISLKAEGGATCLTRPVLRDDTVPALKENAEARQRLA